MEPIRSRAPNPSRESQPGSDEAQPIAGRLASTAASSPLDGLPARPAASRTRQPATPEPSPAFSVGSVSELLRQFDPSLCIFPSLSAYGADVVPGESTEVQSVLRASYEPPSHFSAAVAAPSPTPPRALAAARTPEPSPAFSVGSVSELLRQFDPSLCIFPSLSAYGADAVPGESTEVQSVLRASYEPPSHFSAAVAAPSPTPPRAQAAARRRSSAQTSDASPAESVDLSTLGYTQKQREQIKPDAWSKVAQHHAVLAGHGFTHVQIVELSRHAASLGTVADRYQAIIAVLPKATHKQIVEVGKRQSGARALQTLLKVAEDLRGPPLQLETCQLIKIAKRGGALAVETVHASRNALTGEPLHLTPTQVVAIAGNDGGRQALETLQRLLPVLCQAPYALTPRQVVAIAGNIGGKQALETVQRLLPV
ncbi:hypothetical protein XhyaCFBP1156_19665, partial [Xanthomonas hyacinthi]